MENFGNIDTASQEHNPFLKIQLKSSFLKLISVSRAVNIIANDPVFSLHSALGQLPRHIQKVQVTLHRNHICNNPHTMSVVCQGRLWLKDVKRDVVVNDQLSRGRRDTFDRGANLFMK